MKLFYHNSKNIKDAIKGKTFLYPVLFAILLLSFIGKSWGQSTYNLVTSTSDLVSGAKYIIVSTQTDGTGYAMGYQNTNNRPQATTAVTVASSSITVTPASTTGDAAKPYEITLGGSSGAWTLTDAIYGITLSSVTTANNYLKSGSGTWTISFSSNAAVMTCSLGTRNILRYNSTNSLFSCYASGQSAVYLYKLAPPCTGTPSPGNTVFTSGSNPMCSGVSFTLGLQNYTAGNGVTYDWQSSDDNSFTGASPHLIDAIGTSSTLTTSQTAATYYRCKVTCSGNTGTSTALQITLNSPANCYCIPVASYNTYYITGFSTTGGISNITNTGTSYGITGMGFSNYTAQSVSQNQGSPINFSVALYDGSTYTYGVNIWVDWDNSGTFDSGEKIYNSGSSYVYSASGSFTVPAGASAGAHRMRVLADYNSTDPAACSFASGYGEAEDYTFNVLIPCTQPTTQASIGAYTSTDQTGTTVNWTRGNGTAGVIVVARLTSTTAVDPTSGTSYNANAAFGSGDITGAGNFVVYKGTGTSVAVTGLTSGSNYTFTVYEYNTASTCYKLPGSSSAVSTTCTPPTTQATINAYTNNTTGTSLTANWTRGNGNGVVVVARLTSTTAVDPASGNTYTANTAFGSGTGTAITGTGNYVVYVGTGTTVGITGLSGNTNYTFTVYEYTTAGPCYKTPGSSSAVTTAITYCTSSASSTADEEIYSVTVNGITNAYNCTTVAPGPGSILNRYSNFTTLGALTTIMQGNTIPFTIVEDECDGATYYSNGIAIWIDFNHNGDYTDAGEQVYTESALTISPRTISGSFVVPAGATLGNTGMRITVAEGYYGATLTPCLAYTYGETEDYLVNIIAPPAPTVTSFTPSSGCGGITSVSITGTNFVGVSAVKFGGVNAASYTVNSTTSITAIPATTASGTISVITPGGTATSSSSFTINSTPTLSGTTALCVGSTTTLTPSLTPGTWTSGNGSIATVNSSGVVNGVASGATTITYTYTSSGCTVTAPVTVAGGTVSTLSLCVPGSFTINSAGQSIILNSDFSSTPSNLTTSDYAAISGGELTLTPLASNEYGSAVITKPDATNSSTIHAEWDMYIGGGTTAADGIALSCGDDAAATMNGESGSGTKLIISFDTYENGVGVGYQCSGSNYRGIYIIYGGSVIQCNTNDISAWRTASYQHVILDINSSGQLNLSIGGTAYFTNVALPAAYLSADKSAWKFVYSSRTGLYYDLHKIDNSIIKMGTILEYSKDGTNWQSSNSFTGLAAGSYTFYVRNAGSSSCSANLGTYTVSAAPTVTVSPTTANFCTPPATAVTLTASGASTYAWANSTGLDATSGSTVHASPSTTTTYTVTGTVGSCTNTATTTITVLSGVTMGSVTATPGTICSGANSSLSATATYNVTNTYCTPAMSSVSASGDYLNNFTFADITNNGSGDATNDYTYYSGLTAHVVANGSTAYNISLTAGGTSSTYAQQFRIWIDYNQNGTFETSESVFNTSSATYSPTSATGSITIPNTAYNGITRMRVESRYTTVPSNTSSCLGESIFGEYEDYNVSITGGTTNPASIVSSYVWTPATFLSSTTISNPTATAVTASTTYTVTATATNGCANTATAPVTINPLPTITTAASATPVCYNAGSQTTPLTYSGTTNNPTTYSITWSGTPSNSFVAVTNAALPASPITISVPAGTAVGTYTGTITVKNANGCVSTGTTFTVTVNALPSITTASAAANACFSTSAQTTPLTYSATTNTPTTYSIAWNTLPTNSFVAITNAALPASPIQISVPANTTTGVSYTGNITVKNANGCASASTPFTVLVNPLPTITLAATATSVCYSAGTQTTPISYSAVTNSPTTYSIVWNSSPANSFAAVTDAALTGSPVTISVPAGTAAGTYTGTLTVKNANGCVSTGSNFTVTVNPLPTISTAASATAVCYSSSQQSTPLTYSATNNSPTTYSITWNASPLNTFAAVTNATLNASPIDIIVPGSTNPGSYTGTISVKNANGCVGTGTTFTVTVNALPTITTAATSSDVCYNAGAQTTPLTYSATTSSPTTYSIVWNPSPANSFAAVTNATLPASPITLAVPAGTPVGTYTGTISVANANGCIGGGTNFTVTVNPLPTITSGGTAATVCYSSGSQQTSMTYTSTSQSPTSYSIDWNAAANAAGLADQGSTAFAFAGGGGTITGINIAAGLAAGTYNGTMTVTNANGCTATQSISVIVNPTPTASISGTTMVCAGSSPPDVTFTNPMALAVTITYNINGSSQTTINVGANTTNTVGAPTTTAGTYVYNLVSIVYQSSPVCTNSISGSATITITPNISAVNLSPTATQTICYGGAGTTGTQLTVSETGGGVITARQWKYGSAAGGPFNNTISGATGATYTPSGPDFSGGGTWYVVCTSTPTCGPAMTTSPVTVIVIPNASKPIITSTLLCGATTVSGTTSEAQSQTITIYDGVTAIGHVDIPAGQSTWWVTVSPALVAGASITAQISNTGVSCSSLPSDAGIVIAPVAGTVSGTTPLCVGYTANYASAGADAGGVWSSSNTGVATVDIAGHVTGVGAGSTVITYTITDGTCIKTSSQTVNVAGAITPTISAGGATSFCAGGSVTLTANNGISGSNYLWSTGETTSSITVTASGNYTVGINTTGCGNVSSAPTAVTVFAKPVGIILVNGIPATTSFCAGQNALLSAETSVAGSGSITGYQWWFNDGTTNTSISGATSSTYSANAPGIYSVVITDSNGCTTVACP